MDHFTGTECHLPYSAVIIAEPLREFTPFTRWIQHGAWPSIRRPLEFGPSLPSLYRQPVNRIISSPFVIITQRESWYSFTVPRRIEGWVDLDAGLENGSEKIGFLGLKKT